MILFCIIIIIDIGYCLGVIWPVEGLPSGIRWVANIMPITYAVIAVKGVVSKGMCAFYN